MPDDAAKVLYVSFDVLPDPTGTSARATELLRGLSPVFNTDALTAKTPEHSHIERYYGVRLLRVPVGSGDLPARSQAFERAVRRQLESDEYQLALFSDPHGGYALCELKDKLGLKLVYAPSSFPSIELRYTHPELEGNRKFLAKLQRQELYCLMNSDRVLVPSEVTRSYVAGLGVAAERIHVLPPPVDLKLFGGLPEAPADGPCRLLYVGSMAPWQGLPTLLFALRMAAQKCDVKLAVVAPRLGSWRRELEELIRELKLAGRVEIADPVGHDEVPGLLAQAHLGIAPLEKGDRNVKQGAAPLKIAEALVAGRPVIASDLAITRSMMEDGVHGLLTRPGDATDLCRAIVELATDRPRLQQLAANAREHGRERFDADAARRTVLLLFHELIAPTIVLSPELFGEPAPAEVSDRFTVSSMPTTIGGLPATEAAAAARPEPAPQEPPAPDVSARKPKLRPRVEPERGTDPGSPGASADAAAAPADPARPEPTKVGPAPVREPLPVLTGPLWEPPVEATPIGPGPAAFLEVTPVGPAPGGALPEATAFASHPDESAVQTAVAEIPDEAEVLPDEDEPLGPLSAGGFPGSDSSFDPTPVGPPPVRHPGRPSLALDPSPAARARGHGGEPAAIDPSDFTPVGPPPGSVAPDEAVSSPPLAPRVPGARGAPPVLGRMPPADPAAPKPDWFDQLLLGEVPAAAANRGGDGKDGPSQIVVGKLLDEEEPRRRTRTEDSSPGYKP